MLKDALGCYKGSIEELDRFVEKNPQKAEAYYDRANARNSNGDSAGAIRDYTKAIELGLRPRERYLAYGNRALARLDEGDTAGALDDFTEVIDAQPKNRRILRSSLLNRAVLRRKKGDDNGADLDYRRAVSISLTNK